MYVTVPDSCAQRESYTSDGWKHVSLLPTHTRVEIRANGPAVIALAHFPRPDFEFEMHLKGASRQERSIGDSP